MRFSLRKIHGRFFAVARLLFTVGTEQGERLLPVEVIEEWTPPIHLPSTALFGPGLPSELESILPAEDPDRVVRMPSVIAARSQG